MGLGGGPGNSTVCAWLLQLGTGVSFAADKGDRPLNGSLSSSNSDTADSSAAGGCFEAGGWTGAAVPAGAPVSAWELPRGAAAARRAAMACALLSMLAGLSGAAMLCSCGCAGCACGGLGGGPGSSCCCVLGADCSKLEGGGPGSCCICVLGLCWSNMEGKGTDDCCGCGCGWGWSNMEGRLRFAGDVSAPLASPYGCAGCCAADMPGMALSAVACVEPMSAGGLGGEAWLLAVPGLSGGCCCAGGGSVRAFT